VFHKILIANRGEIALRVIRTCRELGIRSVLAHSKADTHSLPVKLADETICVGPDAARLSYLNIPAIISAAAVTDSEAIHPGYGFLAENPAFAEVCRACSITFIGPSPEAIRLMGDKAQARQIAMQAGVPIVPGSEAPLKDSAEALEVAERIGYPLIFKAAAGGGGRGMRIVKERAEVAQSFDACQSEAGAARSRCWATATACGSTSVSGTARSSGVTRSSSRNRRRRSCQPRLTRGCAGLRSPSPRPSTT